MEIDPKRFNDFELNVYNRLEKLHKENEEITRHVVQLKAVLFGLNSEPGKLNQIDRRLNVHDEELRSHVRTTERLKAYLWPIVGAIILLAWIGLTNIGKLLK